MRKQFVTTISSLVEKDDHLVVLLGDISVWGFHEAMSKHPDRIYNIGILEQSMIGCAAGLSMSGYTPVVHTIAPFIAERGYEQIKDDFGYQSLNGNFVTVGGSYDYASLGCTHHCPADVPILAKIPGINIFVPGTPQEYDELFRASYKNGINYFRLSERKNKTSYAVKPGKANLIKKGSKGTVICVGTTLDAVMEAVSDIDVNVVYYTTVIPFDSQAIEKLENSKIITVEPYYRGLLAERITEKLGEKGYKLKTLGVPTEFLRKYGNAAMHDKYCRLDIDSLHTDIKSFIENT